MPRQVITPDNLSQDFTVQPARPDGPVGLNLNPASFTRDPTTGVISTVAVGGIDALGDLTDVDTTGATNGKALVFNGTAWVPQTVAAGGPTLSDAQVKVAYENNPDTNAFTDAEQAKLAGIATGAMPWVSLTQVEYDALVSPSPGILYIIVG